MAKCRSYPHRAALTGAWLASSIFVLGPAQAQDASLRGGWCASDGEYMTIERSGPGFNDHTVCTWVGKRPTGERIDTSINCANVYESGVRVDEETLRFRVVKTGPRSLSVRIRSAQAVAYAKC